MFRSITVTPSTRASRRSFLRVLAVGPWLLLPFGLVGLFWPALRAHRSGYWIWAMFVPVYGAAVVLFFVTDRYRMPLFVPLCATAGAALLRLFDLVRARRFVPLLLPAGAVLVRCAGGVRRISVSTTGLAGSRRARPFGWSSRARSTRRADSSQQIAHEHSHRRFAVPRRAGLLDAGRQADAVPS